MLYKPHKLNMTCLKLIIAIAVIHGAEPNVYQMFSISAMKVLLISAFASTAEKQCLLSSSPPSSLFVPTGPFCVHGICITSSKQNISSYPHPDELSSKPKCPNKTNIINQQFQSGYLSTSTENKLKRLFHTLPIFHVVVY